MRYFDTQENDTASFDRYGNLPYSVSAMKSRAPFLTGGAARAACAAFINVSLML